jgi:hypothetical protein
MLEVVVAVAITVVVEQRVQVEAVLVAQQIAPEQTEL